MIWRHRKKTKSYQKQIEALEVALVEQMKTQTALRVEVAQNVHKMCSRAALLKERILNRHPDLQQTAEYARTLESRGLLILDRLREKQESSQTDEKNETVVRPASKQKYSD